MATIKSYDDLASAEVDAIQKRIDKTEEERSRIIQQIEDLESKWQKLSDKNEQLQASLKKAQKQFTQLKRFNWTSDNVNIVDLRNQLLLAAKLIKDHT